MAYLHGAVEHNTINGRVNLGVSQVDSCLIVGGLRVLLAHLRLRVGVLRILVGGQGGGVRLIELFGALIGELGVIELTLG